MKMRTCINLYYHSNELNEMLNNFKNNTKNEELKNKLINFIFSSKLNEFKFIENIEIGNNIYKKEDVNAILDLLFLVKNIGNKTAHPNIEPKQSLQIISTQKLLSEFNFESFEEEIEKFITENKIITTENIFLGENESSISKPKNRVFEELISNDNDEEVDEDEHLYYHSNEYEFNNIKLNSKYNLFNKINQYINITKSQIEDKVRNIKNEQISRFNIGNLKKNAKIELILRMMKLYSMKLKILLEY